VLDLRHGLQFVPPAEVEGSDDAAVCSGADIVVITAGAKQKAGQARLELAGVNAGICRELIPRLLAAAPDAIILMVSNPVDVLTYAALKISGLPRPRVMGSGTVLDSSRFRHLIAQRCRAAVSNVHGYIVGEHGDSEIPLWSAATIANIPLHTWSVAHHGRLTVRDRAEIFSAVKNAAEQVIQGKGATNFAIGLATAQILAAILNDENRVLPVSSLLSNYRGISDVCLSAPCILNRSGVEEPLDVPMNEAEAAGLANSAAAVKKVIATLGF
jgi:L-lactate dehydrogenase